MGSFYVPDRAHPRVFVWGRADLVAVGILLLIGQQWYCCPFDPEPSFAGEAAVSANGTSSS